MEKVRKKITKMAKYYVHFGTCSGDFVAYTLEWAKELADQKAAYTQENISIFELKFENCETSLNENSEPICVRKWWGIPYDANVADCVDPIGFGDFGYYSDWE